MMYKTSSVDFQRTFYCSQLQLSDIIAQTAEEQIGYLSQAEYDAMRKDAKAALKADDKELSRLAKKYGVDLTNRSIKL